MSAQADGAPRTKATGGSIYLAFIPWVAFSIIAQHDSLLAAALVALGAALVIAAPSLMARRPKVIEVGAIAAFAAFTVVALIADPGDDAFLTDYARAIAAGLLAAIALGSLLFTPFTEQYARESVPPEFWNSPRFKKVNHDLTLLWGVVFVAMVPCHIIAGAVDTRRANTIFNWVIPILLVVFAAKQTAKVSEKAHDEHPQTSAG